jgi:hypothetical protein
MKKYIFILLYFIILQASAQNRNLLKGSFSAAKETEIPLLAQVSTCAISNIIPIIQKYLILSVHLCWPLDLHLEIILCWRKYLPLLAQVSSAGL